MVRVSRVAVDQGCIGRFAAALIEDVVLCCLAHSRQLCSRPKIVAEEAVTVYSIGIL